MSLFIEHLAKKFQFQKEEIQVLSDINLRVEKGECVAILGQSGSGKSTLLSLIAGIQQPDHGKILLNNHDITEMNKKDLISFRGKNIGIVFQNYHLLSYLTALENVALPLDIANDPSSTTKAKVFLDAVGLSNRAQHFPSQLSGGECQRVALARALITEPQLLLADEPTGSLDIETGNKVMEIFFNVVERLKTPTILVTHNLELAKQCNRIVHLENGRISGDNL